MNTNTKKLIIFFLFIFLFVFSGCSYKIKKKNAESFFLKNPVELAKLCNYKFPVKEKFIKGNEVILKDTLKTVEKIFIDCNQEKNKIVECPKSQIREIIKSRVDTFIKKDEAQIYLLNSEINTLIKENKDIENKLFDKDLLLKKTHKKYKVILCALISFVSFIVVYNIFKIIRYFKV